MCGSWRLWRIYSGGPVEEFLSGEKQPKEGLISFEMNWVSSWCTGPRSSGVTVTHRILLQAVPDVAITCHQQILLLLSPCTWCYFYGDEKVAMGLRNQKLKPKWFSNAALYSGFHWKFHELYHEKVHESTSGPCCHQNFTLTFPNLTCSPGEKRGNPKYFRLFGYLFSSGVL